DHQEQRAGPVARSSTGGCTGGQPGDPAGPVQICQPERLRPTSGHRAARVGRHGRRDPDGEVHYEATIGRDFSSRYFTAAEKWHDETCSLARWEEPGSAG